MRILDGGIVQIKRDVVFAFRLRRRLGSGRLGRRALRNRLAARFLRRRRSGLGRGNGLAGARRLRRLLACHGRGLLRCGGILLARLRLGRFALCGSVAIREHFSRVYCGPTKAQQHHREHHRESLVPKRIAVGQARNCRSFLSLLRFLIHFNPPHQPFAFDRLLYCFRRSMHFPQTKPCVQFWTRGGT